MNAHIEQERVVTIVMEFPVASFTSVDEIKDCLTKFEMGVEHRLGVQFHRAFEEAAIVYAIPGIPESLADKAAKVLAIIAKAAGAPRNTTVLVEDDEDEANGDADDEAQAEPCCIRCGRVITGTNVVKALEGILDPSDLQRMSIVTCPDCDPVLVVFSAHRRERSEEARGC